MAQIEDRNNPSNKMGVNADGSINTATAKYTSRFAYNSDGDLEYYGIAVAGSATSEAVWQIRKYFYDSDGNLISVVFADGDTKYNNIWDNRTSLSYSLYKSFTVDAVLN